MPESIDKIPYEAFRGSIRDALKGYSEKTDGRITFNLAQATALTPVPEESYSRRSNARMLYEGRFAGELATHVLAPGDKTGKEGTYQLAEIKTGKYPRKVGIVPRAETGVTAAVALTIVSFDLQDLEQPKLYAGSAELLTVSPEKRLRNFGRAGQPLERYREIMAGEAEAKPTATFIVAGYDTTNRFDMHPPAACFGKSLALYNDDTESVQIVSVFRLTGKSELNQNIVSALDPSNPQ